jgi:hypothetical protein
VQAGLPRQFLADASGRVAPTPAKGATVGRRVPVYSAPKPVSAISTPGSVDFKGGATQAVLSLTGKGVDQGTGSHRYHSLISVFELQGESGRLPACDRDVTENCTLNDAAKGGDLRYVGAASTAPHWRNSKEIRRTHCWRSACPPGATGRTSAATRCRSWT